MKKVPFFSTFQGPCMALEIPSFFVFLGTSMRATFHIKFSDRDHVTLCSITTTLAGEHVQRSPWNVLEIMYSSRPGTLNQQIPQYLLSERVS